MTELRCPRRDELGDTSMFKLPEADHWRDDGAGKHSCSFCGSCRPEDVFSAIENNIELSPTDKNYKVYVGDTKKFYFQHFSKDDMLKFIDLMNQKKIKLAYPGHFYCDPYFVSRGNPNDNS